MDLRDVYDRVYMAAEVGGAAVNRFGDTEQECPSPAPGEKFVLGPITTNANRSTILLLSIKLIIRALKDKLPIDIDTKQKSVDPEADLPTDVVAATELVQRFAADAEAAFEDMIDRLSYVITSDDKRFWPCIVDLLRYLAHDNAQNWKLISHIATKREPYKYTFVDKRIEGPASVIWLLKDLKRLAPDMCEQMKVDAWMTTAVDRLYDIAASVRAARPNPSPYGDGRNDEVLIGQAAVRIWDYDKNYRESQAWFPPSHQWWPFHLPGKPKVIRQHQLPNGKVAHVQFLPWGADTVAIGMADGIVLIFTSEKTEPLRTINTGLFPATIGYGSVGIMVKGNDAYRQEGPVRSYLILSREGMRLSGTFITERKPTRAEEEKLESVGRWRRDKLLKKFTQCAIPINEGLVTYPDTHPDHLTLGQVSTAFGRNEYLFWRDSRQAVLKQAEFNNWGQLKIDSSSEHFRFRLGYEAPKSRIVIDSRDLHHQNSFLVAPGATHFDIAHGEQVLALAGNGHLYLYG